VFVPDFRSESRWSLSPDLDLYSDRMRIPKLGVGLGPEYGSFAAIAERVENTNVSFMGRMFLVQSGSGPMQARHGVRGRCLRRTIPFLSDSIVVV